MTSLEQLTNKGYIVTFSIPSQIVYWGKWYVGIRNDQTKSIIHGYGENENLALENALQTALVIHQK